MYWQLMTRVRMTSAAAAPKAEKTGEVCIGDRDLVAAGVVADRPGVGSGAARSDQQSPGFRFHLREGAAARADGFNIDDRLQHAKALDDGFLRVAPVTLGDESDVEARAAHVRGNDVFMFQ